MKNNISEPPGSRLSPARRSNVINLPKTLIEPQFRNSGIYPSVDDMVHELRPEAPVYCLRPETIATTARRFLKQFPGEVMYAVKCNPDPRVLRYLTDAGVKHFDVASIAEVKLVSELLPDAELYFMHPVRSRESIRKAYFEYGVRHFSLDSHEELQKILEVTENAGDLNLYVRLAIANESAAYSLAGRYGVALEQAAELIRAVRNVAFRLGVCFHVGSQCMQPGAYGTAMSLVADLLVQANVKLDVLDIGGGFPSIYPGMTPPPVSDFMKAIKKALKSYPKLAECQLLCEPGRALVAEGGSTVARVDLRKGNMLYLNEGTYGSLFDAGHPGFVFPVKAIRPSGNLSHEMTEFGFYGPTCDSLDTMKGPFLLPSDITEGDWIEIGQLGAYGATMRTNFNGFYSDTVVEVGDKPILSLYGVN